MLLHYQTTSTDLSSNFEFLIQKTQLSNDSVLRKDFCPHLILLVISTDQQSQHTVNAYNTLEIPMIREKMWIILLHPRLLITDFFFFYINKTLFPSKLWCLMFSQEKMSIYHIQTNASFIAELKSSFQDLVFTEENLKNWSQKTRSQQEPPNRSSCLGYR